MFRPPLVLLLLVCGFFTAHANQAHGQSVQILERQPQSDHPTVGPDDAPVTLEFFLHLGNAHSGRAHEMVQQLIARHPKRLRVIYRLTEKGRRSSSLAQNFAREAFAQGRFFEFLDAYYAARKPYPRTEMYPQVALAAGVNYERVQKALDTMEHEVGFLENYYYWRRVQINQVPGFRFNGRNADRIRSLDELEEFYDQALADARRLRASGVAPDKIAERLADEGQEERYANKQFRGPLDGEPLADPPQGPSPVPMAQLAAGALAEGPEDAEITMVFVCHFQSVLCRGMSRNLEDIRKAYPDEVRIVFRTLYDSGLPGQDKAPLMHQAALCANDQGAFWEFYRHAFDNQRRINFDQSLAVELASSAALDLDVPRFEKCLESGAHVAELAKERAMVRAAGIQHTPALVIGGVAYWGRYHFTDIRMMLHHALRPGLIERLGSP